MANSNVQAPGRAARIHSSAHERCARVPDGNDTSTRSPELGHVADRRGGVSGEPGPSGSPNSEPRFLRIDEIGRLLRVSRSTAYAMVASKLIPSVRFSPRVVRVDRIALEAWLADRNPG